MADNWAMKLKFTKHFLRTLTRYRGIFLYETEFDRCARLLAPYIDLPARWDLTMDSTNTRIVHCRISILRD